MYRREIRVDHRQVAAGGVEDFPLLVVLRDAALGRVGEIYFTDGEGKALDFYLEECDRQTGKVRAWVRLSLADEEEVVLYVCGGEGGARALRPEAFWKEYCLVHSAGGRVEGSATGAALTVEAWVRAGEARAEGVQTLVSQWAWRERMDAFATFDAGNTSGLLTRGFFGAVFDGRYVYFSPQHDGRERHGKVLRLDTHGDFSDPQSWEAYDAGNTSGLLTRGYYGAVFDGRYVYFVPRHDGKVLHTRLLRLDTHGDFSDPQSWEARDMGLPLSCQSAAFDGRHIYFVPGYWGEGGQEKPGPCGLVLRYDTRADFHDADSYARYEAGQTGGLDCRCYDGAVFDGRHVYFAPLDEKGIALRYDVGGDFERAESWQAFRPEGLSACVGAIFDGRHIYYVPYAHSTAVRFDTEGDFTDAGSWEARDVGAVSGLKTRGYDGAAFDGRYVYFIPFWEGGDASAGFHARLLRYDPSLPFADAGAWTAADGGALAPPNPGGFNGGAFDGRFLYMAPWRLGTSADGDILAHGQVLRYDTAGEGARFQLRYMDCGHNGGLCAALPGPSFTANAERGAVQVRANAVPGPGWHYLVGVYDGERARLYLDGEQVAGEEGLGALLQSRAQIRSGEDGAGPGRFRGEVGLLRVAATARSSGWIETAYRNLVDPENFARLSPPAAG